MAKIPKFNLTMDGELVRSIEELQNNFSVDDILDHFESKRLQKWLKSRGFTDYLTKVEAIQSSDKGDIIKELMDIFEIDYSQDDLADIRAQLNYTPRQSTDSPTVTVKSKQGDETTSNLSDSFNLDYEHQKYNDLIDEIINNPEDLTVIKKNIELLCTKYYSFYSLDYKELIAKFASKSDLALCAILDNPKAFELSLNECIKLSNGFSFGSLDDVDFSLLHAFHFGSTTLSPSAYSPLNENYKLFSHIKKVSGNFEIKGPALFLYQSKELYCHYDNHLMNMCIYNSITFKAITSTLSIPYGCSERDFYIIYLDLSDYNIPDSCNQRTEEI